MQFARNSELLPKNEKIRIYIHQTERKLTFHALSSAADILSCWAFTADLPGGRARCGALEGGGPEVSTRSTPICRRVSCTRTLIATRGTALRSSGADCGFAVAVTGSAGSSGLGVVKEGVFCRGAKGTVPRVIGVFNKMGVRRDLHAVLAAPPGVLFAGLGAGGLASRCRRIARISVSRLDCGEIISHKA